MKRKGFPSRSKSLLKWHVFIFMVVMVPLWFTIPSMTYSPDPVIAGVVVNAKQHTVNLISVMLIWLTILIVHFGLDRYSRMAQQSPPAVIRDRQDSALSTARLDLEAATKHDKQIDEDEWIAQHRLQSK